MSCYICGKDKTFEWYSLWYDGEQRKICSPMCRYKIEDLCNSNTDKTFSHKTTEEVTK